MAEERLDLRKEIFNKAQYIKTINTSFDELGNTTITEDLIVQPTTRVRAIVRDVLLVVGFALLTAAAAQIEIQLGFTPVPLTGQTFAVLLSGAVLGMRRGALSQLVYWMAGLTGLPFYSGGAGGWKSGTGATLGYLVGFIVAAGAIGYLAEKKQDRNFATSLPAMLLGSTLIYTCGAAWLTTYLNIGFATGETNAIALGVAPFLVGDVIKALLAAACTTGVWAAINKRK